MVLDRQDHLPSDRLLNAAHRKSDIPRCPPALPGLENVQRFFDPGIGAWVAKVLPGEYYITANHEVVSTILGSCVSVCIRDTATAIGGINHFMLPEDQSGGRSGWLDPCADVATRYGYYAIERLLNELKNLGASHERLEAKIVGGGRMLANMADLGAKNIEFARRYLAAEGLRVVAEDVGGFCPRRILYFPQDGRLLVRRLHSLNAQAIAERERRYLTAVNDNARGNDVELFEVESK